MTAPLPIFSPGIYCDPRTLSLPLDTRAAVAMLAEHAALSSTPSSVPFGPGKTAEWTVAAIIREMDVTDAVARAGVHLQRAVAAGLCLVDETARCIVLPGGGIRPTRPPEPPAPPEPPTRRREEPAPVASVVGRRAGIGPAREHDVLNVGGESFAVKRGTVRAQRSYFAKVSIGAAGAREARAIGPLPAGVTTFDGWLCTPAGRRWLVGVAVGDGSSASAPSPAPDSPAPTVVEAEEETTEPAETTQLAADPVEPAEFAAVVLSRLQGDQHRARRGKIIHSGDTRALVKFKKGALDRFHRAGWGRAAFAILGDFIAAGGTDRWGMSWSVGGIAESEKTEGWVRDRIVQALAWDADGRPALQGAPASTAKVDRPTVRSAASAEEEMDAFMPNAARVVGAR